MTYRDILTIRKGQCRFCVTDDTPFIFCAAPTFGESPYCEGHHFICYRGQGADVALLEGMMNHLEGTIRKTGTERSKVVPVDELMRGDE